MHRLDLGLYSYPKEFGGGGGMEFEPMLTPREISPLPEHFPRGGSNPRRCGQRAQTLPTSYSGPFKMLLNSRAGERHEPGAPESLHSSSLTSILWDEDDYKNNCVNKIIITITVTVFKMCFSR